MPETRRASIEFPSMLARLRSLSQTVLISPAVLSLCLEEEDSHLPKNLLEFHKFHARSRLNVSPRLREQLIILSVTAALVLFSGLTDAKPCQELSRPKRTSDQRLAELETLIALSKMNGKLVTIPIGFGKIDPNKIGRRRRSVSLLLQQLINDLSTEDKRSDEMLGSPAERREEDGGETKEEAKGGEEEGEEAEGPGFLLEGKLSPHLPVRLPE